MLKLYGAPITTQELSGFDPNDALKVPGVIALFTASDIPGLNRYKRQREDQPVLAEEVVRFQGEPVALVAAETEEAAKEGTDAVQVDQEVFEPLSDPVASLEGAPNLHPGGHVMAEERPEKGDVELGLARTDIVLEETYRTGFVEHAYLEPEAGSAYLDSEWRVVVFGPTQSPHHDQREIAKVLDVPVEKVRLRQCVIGGAFGGKIDMSVQCLVALVTYRLRRPARMAYTREESFLSTTKRHPFTVTCNRMYSQGANNGAGNGHPGRYRSVCLGGVRRPLEGSVYGRRPLPHSECAGTRTVCLYQLIHRGSNARLWSSPDGICR